VAAFAQLAVVGRGSAFMS